MPTEYTIPSGLGLRQKKALAALLVCAPCCGEGSGAGSGVPMPNGCADCECCPCVCWWYTDWHKSLTADSFLRDTLVAPTWTLISNGLVNVGGDPDYLYLGSIGGGLIGGATAIDGNGNITSDVPPNPQWTGDLVYNDGSDTVTVNVTMLLSFTMPCPCDGEFADAVTWAGTAINSVTPPTYTFDLNGTITPPLGLPEAVDYSPLPNDLIGGSGTIVDCAGTIDIDGAGVALPDLTITPMYDPDCIP